VPLHPAGLAGAEGAGGRCRQIIAHNFGAEAVAQIDAALAR